MPRGYEGAEALTGRTAELERDGVVGQAGAAVASRHLRAEHRADGAVDVADGSFESYPPAVVESRSRQASMSSTSSAAPRPWSWSRRAMQRGAAGAVDRRQDGPQIELCGLPVMIDCGGAVQALDMPDGLGDGAESERGEQLAHFLGDVLEEGLDELGPPGEVLPELGVLRCDADRASVEMADAHHDAARHHERGGREAELLCPEQRRHDDVTTGLDLAVDLNGDAVPQPIAQQGLLGLGQSELPGRAGVLEGGERRRAGAAVVARDEDDVSVSLGHACCDRADAHLGDELHVDAGASGCAFFRS